ncbi:MAG: alpha/beta fold hydrolase [Pseudonocardiaceae bacterium]
MPTADVRWFTTPDGTRLALRWHGPRSVAASTLRAGLGGDASTLRAGLGGDASTLRAGLGAPLTIVLAHGWIVDSRVWEPVAAMLSSGPRGLPVLCYDLRGHGQSGPIRPGTATIAALADDLAGLLRAEVEGAVVLVGHSMGSMAIMALAQQHPELVAQRVAGAVFASSSCGDLMPLDLGLRPGLARLVARGEPHLMRWASASRRLRDRDRTTTWVGLVRPGVRWLQFGEHPRRADVQLAATCVAQCRPANFVDFRATFDDHDQAAALAAFRNLPTLVLAGTRDRLTPIRHSERIAAALPDATFVRYAGAGHMVTLERAEQIAGRIGELVATVRARRRLPAE